MREQPSLEDVRDRVLEKGIIIDNRADAPPAAIDLVATETRIVVVAIEMYFEDEPVAPTAELAIRAGETGASARRAPFER
jgi:hypothetical protein